MIIDSEELYNKILADNKQYFVVPFGYDNRLHSKENSICAITLVDCQSEDSYTVAVNHPDSIYSQVDLSSLFRKDCILFNKHIFQYNGYNVDNLPDADVISYLSVNKVPDQSENQLVGFYKRKYSNCLMVNKIIPIHKLEEIAYDIFTRYIYAINESIESVEYYNKAQSVFHSIEKNGIKLNEQLFTAFYGKTYAKIDQYCYGKYNLFTSTGRPSNTFGGVNLAAINKEDGSRDCFVSRYEGGILLEIDFESYHPRIICDLIDYEVNENIYEHLSKLYYPDEPVTDALIKQSKENTFRQIYGGVDKKYLGIELFAGIDNLTKTLYGFYKKHRYVELPSGRKLRLIDEEGLNSHKVFNYFIQALETENNVAYLSEFLTYFKDTSILPVLYVYDSILFDLKKDDLEKCIATISKVIDIKKYPIKIKTGTTYSELIEL